MTRHWFFVASGLAPRWAAKPPQHPHHVLPDTPRGMVLGLLRSPAGDKPPCHRGLCSSLQPAAHHWLFCGERACPALGGKAAPTPSPRSTRYTEGNGFGSAAQPSGGQAPLPQRAMQQPATCCPPLAFLWRAGLPRAGRQRRPNTLTKFYQIHRGGWFWVCCAAQRGTSPLATGGFAAVCNLLPTTGFSCGERACPALGGKAAPIASPSPARYTEGACPS